MLLLYLLLFIFLVWMCKQSKHEQFGGSDWNYVHWGVQQWNGWPY